MLYNLVIQLEPWLTDIGLFGYVRPLTYPEFRAVASIILGFLIVVLFGKRTIRWLLKAKIGDVPEFNHADLDKMYRDKAKTPTMGGILIASAIGVSTLLLADLTSFYVHMALLCLLWLAILGGIDDWLKLTTARRKPGSRDGLYTWEKIVFQFGLAVVLGLFVHHYGMTKWQVAGFDGVLRMSHSLTLPLAKSWVFDVDQRVFAPSPNLIVLGPGLFVMLSILVIAGSSNAVNLSDGMDGLASGITAICAFAFMVLALIAGREDTAKFLLVPWIPMSNELAIVCGAMMGACLGFLWFNCSPAQVFMGDTGSLPLGGLLGFIAVVIRQEFLLLIIGGIFVLEALSVVMQVGYFKMTRGKRLFRCAPIHHHFHLAGWAEQQVVVRFWLLSALLAAIALATIKLR
jgi:phospho-N-acetylmuramoyl-pentapeptide-transferase